MSGRSIPAIACTLALSLGGVNLLFAQSRSLAAVLAGAPDDKWTVLTMAPDGAWGAATDAAVNQAIARALSSCKTMSRAEIGCGAYSTAIRSGWSLGIRCGRNNIVVSANDLGDAERAASERERVLRQSYVPDMPPCRRVVTIDPGGAIVVAEPDDTHAAVPASDPAEAAAAPSAVRPLTPMKAVTDAPIWKTITLGTYRDVNILREDLDSLHCGVTAAGGRQGRAVIPGTATPLPCALGESAAEMIGRPAFALAGARTQADLVVLSVPELGFEGNLASVADIHARARQLGLELCPAEIGPQLRLQYLDQPAGEFLRIAMEPIATYGGDLIDLTVANDGASLLLVGGDANAAAIVHASVRFVFMRPAQIADGLARDFD